MTYECVLMLHCSLEQSASKKGLMHQEKENRTKMTQK